MNRTTFIKTGSTLSFSWLVAPSILLSGCKRSGTASAITAGVEAETAVVAPELFVFELLFNLLFDKVVGEVVTASCEAVFHNSELCELISAMFVDLKGNLKMPSKSNGTFKWSREGLPENTLKIMLNSMDDGLDLIHNVSLSKSETDDCTSNKGLADYVQGLGKYPLASTHSLCKEYQLYPIQESDLQELRLMQYEIIARRGYRIPYDDELYSTFASGYNEKWYNAIKRERQVYNLDVAINRLNHIEYDNYNYLDDLIYNIQHPLVIADTLPSSPIAPAETPVSTQNIPPIVQVPLASQVQGYSATPSQDVFNRNNRREERIERKERRREPSQWRYYPSGRGLPQRFPNAHNYTGSHNGRR